MIPPEDLLYIPTLKEGRLPMIMLEEIPGSGFIHDASTMTWVALRDVEAYLDRNYVIIDDPAQVEAFDTLQKESGHNAPTIRKAGFSAIGFELLQFAFPVFLLVAIAILSLFPPFHKSIGPFDLPTAMVINNAAVLGISGIGGTWALVRVLRQVDFRSTPVLSYVGLVAGLSWIGLVVFHLLVV